MVALPAPASKTGERRGGRNGWGARDLDKTLGHCTTVKTVGGPKCVITCLFWGPATALAGLVACRSLYSCATIT